LTVIKNSFKTCRVKLIYTLILTILMTVQLVVVHFFFHYETAKINKNKYDFLIIKYLLLKQYKLVN